MTRAEAWARVCREAERRVEAGVPLSEVKVQLQAALDLLDDREFEAAVGRVTGKAVTP